MGSMDEFSRWPLSDSPKQQSVSEAVAEFREQVAAITEHRASPGRVVQPHSFDGWSVSLHPGGPKFTIVCGNCGVAFRHRIHRGIDRPRIPCPHCNVLNQMPLVWEAGP